MQQPASEAIIKTYPKQGALQQYRLIRATDFHCCECNKSKKAKLIAVRHGNWNETVCNGCYGLLLSKA